MAGDVKVSDWITIAHLEATRSNRVYSLGNLLDMAKRINHTPMLIGWREGVGVDLAAEKAVGVTERARLADDQLQIQVRWKDGIQPRGYIVPIGEGEVRREIGGHDFVLPAYELIGLYVGPHSTFQRATRL